MSGRRRVLAGAAALLAAALLLAGCDRTEAPPEAGLASPGLPPGAQALSLSGQPLYPPELPAEVRSDREDKLARARADYEANPGDADTLIWFGRRTAYLGRYREAIEIFTEGIAKRPGDPRMLRHRGHRWISVRELERAVEDLERAAALIEGTEDQVEPDGLPNARNIPTSTLQSNIWYHLGLAYYLQDDLPEAARAYRKCLEVSGNPDMLVATSHWLYMTLRRLGLDDEARRVIEPITADMDIIENQGYHRLLLLYRGGLTPEALLDEALSAGGLENAAVAYGVGNWLGYSGREEESRRVLEQVLESDQWAAFGFLAAEADLARAGGGG